MFPEYFACVGIQPEHQSVFGTAENNTLFFNRHGRGVLISESDIRSPYFFREVGSGRVTYDTVVHGFTVNSPFVFRQADGLTYHRFFGSPYGFSGRSIDSCQCSFGVGDKYFSICRHGPNGRCRIESTRFPFVPFPNFFSCFLIEGIEVFIPCSEYHEIVVNEGFGFYVAFYAVVTPNDSSRFDVDCAKFVVAASDVGYSVSYGNGSQYGCFGVYFPQQSAVGCVQTVYIHIG